MNANKAITETSKDLHTESPDHLRQNVPSQSPLSNLFKRIQATIDIALISEMKFLIIIIAQTAFWIPVICTLTFFVPLAIENGKAYDRHICAHFKDTAG